MIVMVDATLRAHIQQDDKIRYLFELLAEQPIQAHLYAVDSPPTYTQEVIATETGVEGVRDWVATSVTDDDIRLWTRPKSGGIAIGGKTLRRWGACCGTVREWRGCSVISK
jgi:hypothetical protein